MPPRLTNLARARPCLHRGLATSRVLCQVHDMARRNHYERLDVRQDASAADIKKSFYRLSKAHHPDTNRHDPHASHTFSLLSESYTVLSDGQKRAAYDRDVLRSQSQPQSHSYSPYAAAGNTKASYHSTGGRPASGLSRRRSTFRGPPPSFYAQGGWGAHAEKRRRAHEESTGTRGGTYGAYSSSSQQQSSNASSAGSARSSAGTAEGSRTAAWGPDVPHFDRDGHARTQRREDDKRWQRARRRAVDEDNVEFEPQMSIGAHFSVIVAILAASFALPAWYLRSRRRNARKAGQGQGQQARL